MSFFTEKDKPINRENLKKSDDQFCFHSALTSTDNLIKKINHLCLIDGEPI